MKFKLKQNPTNLYPKGAFLIQEASPYVWLKELQKMGFNLSEITAFPIPSLVPNKLYGCLIVYKKLVKGLNIGKHRYFQNCHNLLFIPENTVVSPAFTDEEWDSIFSENPHVYHPDFGLVALSEPINWLAILNPAVETFPSIQVARKGVAIPQSITSLQIAVDQEALLKQLENPISEEEALAKLPFDMKKVLRGNQKEIDKYLKFLDEHPEMALKYAIPLDVLNTNRGNLNGKYRFGSSFKERFRGFFSSRKSSPAYGGSSGSGGGGGFSGSSESESWFSSDTFKFLLRIVFFLFLFGRAVSMSSGVMFGLLKAIFYIGIFLGVLYLIYRFLKNREDRPFNAGPSGQNAYPNRSTRSVTPENDLYKYLPFIVVFLIVGLSIAFVKFISSDHVDFSISPIFYLLGFFAIVFAVVFLVVKLLDKIQSSRQNHAERGGSTALLDTDRFST